LALNTYVSGSESKRCGRLRAVAAIGGTTRRVVADNHAIHIDCQYAPKRVADARSCRPAASMIGAGARVKVCSLARCISHVLWLR
jgi:hypothetical protein